MIVSWECMNECQDCMVLNQQGYIIFKVSDLMLAYSFFIFMCMLWLISIEGVCVYVCKVLHCIHWLDQFKNYKVFIYLFVKSAKCISTEEKLCK